MDDVMNDLSLNGCRNDTLLGYLKALGVLRVVATQIDPGARGSWSGATFVIRTRLERGELVGFLLESYCPTPIANPWNNGAGFSRIEAKSPEKINRASAIIQEVRSTASSRWASYRRIIDFVFEKYVETGIRDKMLTAGQKDEFIRMLRGQLPEEGLPWIDAVVGITVDDVGYPFLFGSGGNDGNFEFSVNFAERALGMVGDDPARNAPQLLRDSLEETALGALTPKVAIGQFSARHAGGVNASNGRRTDSLVNDWDYILMMEGSVCFRAAAVRRFGTGRSQSVLPFAFRAVAGGYGSASALEKPSGELWLPVWDGTVGYAGLTDLFRRGRIDMPNDGSTSIVRSAATASEAATAAVTMGVSVGLREFKRVAFFERNGKSNIAATSGEVRVTRQSNPIVARISRSSADWVERVRGIDVAKTGEIAELLRKFDDTLFAIAHPHAGDTLREQGLLLALARLEYAVARMAPEYPPPLPYLDSDLIEDGGDQGVERRLAAALSSLGGRDLAMRIRLDLEHVEYNDAKWRLVYDNSRRPLLSSSIEDTLSAICARRVRFAREGGDAGWLLGTRCVGVGDVAAMLESRKGGALRKRVAMVLVAYSVVDAPSKARTMTGEANGAQLPAAYAVMKVVVDHPKASDPRIIAYLCARDSRRALELAAQRARTIDGLPARFREISGARIDDPRWYAAALLVPIERSALQYGALLKAALVQKPGPGEAEHYLRTISPELVLN